MKELLLYIGLISVGLIIGNYLPSYTKEKGKNLATKEDIKEITKKTEEVKQEFNEKFGEFSKKLDFKYRFYEEQMINLYSNLYAMIAQSEYLRYFIREYRNKNVSFDEAPFWEVKKGKQHQKTEDDVTRVRKIEIANEIIKNSKYAENRLLKLAVAYRYINKNYSNGDTSHLEEKRKYDIEEIKLLGAMLKLIIKKYNFLARELGLSYSEYELKNGIFKEDEFDVSDLYTFKEE